jgi:peroxiredoxin family protein
MGLQSYTVSFTVDDGVSWTALTDVQNIQFSIGRQAQLDQIKSSYGSFEMRYPTGYASPVTALVSGTVIRIQNTTGTAYTVFTGRIDNVTAQYGIPYAGGVGQADYLNVTFEGAFAIAGRMQGNDYAMAAGTIVSQMSAASTETGIFLTFDGSSSLAATTVSTTWGDWINRVCQSTNSRIWDAYDTKNISVINPFSSYVNTVNFSDTANDSTNQVYNLINFDSLADNFYTQVTVTPESFGSATVTKVGATAPYRTYQANTLNNSTLQASDYASYLLSNYDTPRFAISSFSCMAEAQASFQLDKIGGSSILAQSPGTQVGVTFRGTTYQCIIEGVTVSATPAGAMFTYYVSGADLNAYLILDNATFGVLDANKLGY